MTQFAKMESVELSKLLRTMIVRAASKAMAIQFSSGAVFFLKEQFGIL